MGALVGDAIEGLGIELHRETKVEGFDTDAGGHVRAVVTSNGTIAADVVVLGIGVQPNVALARDAGIASDRAAGSPPTDAWRPARRACGRPATASRRFIASRVGRSRSRSAPTRTSRDASSASTRPAAYAAFPGVIGTAVTKVCAYEIGRTGCSEHEAREAGFEYVTAKIESTSRAGYYPGAKPITVKVLAERRTGRLLGAQIIGREGAAKRIDVMATAIWNEMTADDFSQLDLGYAPPFSPDVGPDAHRGPQGRRRRPRRLTARVDMCGLSGGLFRSLRRGRSRTSS